ncbi:calcium-responsive transcription factor isoform X2 [Lepidochelys kempii]|uniref:calcium-responsive transcription factor isoform X2 n=1 Tax=Lepidochelys kempii TaxID=8472 RepID=UPI003C6FA994
MEENGVDHDVSMETSNDLLVVNCNSTGESETDDQVFQHLTCMDSRDPSFEQNDSPAVLPITVHVSDNSSVSSNTPVQLSQAQPLSTEEFHLVDQNGQPLYELQSLGDSSTQMMIVASQSEHGPVLHVIPSTQPGMAQVIIPQGQLLDVTSTQGVSEEKRSDGNLQTVAVAAIADSTSSYILHPQASLTVSKKTTSRIVEDLFPVPLQPLPPNTPTWARRLRNCEKIGDSYRGYCVSETELESVLTLHKQQTQSVWGTRQSPSPAKPATRLMWKSQYVPYDGIPFINAGSRAIVMECQYGPRRKGFQPKKTGEPENASCQLYKATCPARIYIKKVQKFPEYRVPTDPKIDKKIIRMEQEKAFNMLKKNLIDAGGVLRWYVQLPTQQAHQYHEMETCLPPSPSAFPISPPEEDEDAVRDENCTLPSRLHPQVADKIRELVSQGIEQVYAVRKQLRKFVERELFKPEEVPERHNLSFFPTVNDIKNHIHEVQKSLGNGEMVYNSESIPATLQWTTDGGNVLTETVTVTFASPPTEGSLPGDSIATKVESSQTGENLPPETAQLLSSLSSLQPKIFAQLQGLQLQPTFTSVDGATALIAVNNHSAPNPASLLDSIGSVITNHSLVLSQGHNLHTGASLTQSNNAASAIGNLPISDQNLVTMGQLVTVGGVEDTGSLEGGIHQFLLGDVQTIPIRIVDNHPALSSKLDTTKQQRRMKTFYRLALDIVVMNKVCKIFRKGLMGFRGFQFIDMTAQESLAFGMEEDKKYTKLSFDHNEFKIRKDHFPLKAIQITKKKPEWRTEKEIKLLQSWLQFVESYRKYSLNLQLLLAKVIRFERGLDLFATWPDYSVEKIASYCKAEKFHYGQVIVRDIPESASIIFITQGKCEVLRLVDLTTCPSYHKWISQQMDFPKLSPYYSMETDITGRKRFNNFMWKSFPVQDLSNLKSMYVPPLNPQKDENFKRQYLALNRKYKNAHTKLEKEDRGDSRRYDDFSDDEKEVVQKEISGLFRKKLTVLTPYGEIPTAVATAIYTRVDEVHKGELLGISQHLLPEDKQDNRSMVLVSQGAQIIRLKKEKFEELADHTTIMKLHKLQPKYPSDDELCQSFLEQNHWKIFKKDLMNLFLERKLMMMAASSQHVKPKKDIYNSWSVNQAGILDLTTTHHHLPTGIQGLQRRYVPVHIRQGKDSEGLPNIELRLIHGIAVPRPTLKGLF